jgi:transmembrane sensor
VEDKDWQRLARFFSGEASSEEEAETRRWLEEDPGRARMAESLRAVWELSSTLPPKHSGDARRAWNRVESGMRGAAQPAAAVVPAPAVDVLRPQAAPRLRKVVYSVLTAAAVVVVVLSPAVRAPLTRVFTPETSPATAIREYSTREGEPLRLTLSDGSVVELGPNSTLRVPVPFQANRRDVRLEGMAQFTVVPDPARPFLVRAGDAVTRVLGTQFVVRAYSTEETVRVAVVEGRVALGPSSAGDEPAMALISGQVGQLTNDGLASFVRDESGYERLVQWTSGRLKFTDEPLSTVLSELETWYDVRISITDPELASRPVSTEIEGENLQQVLDLISLVVDARYEQSGDNVTFTPQ